MPIIILSETDPRILLFFSFDFLSIGGNPIPNVESNIPPSIFFVGDDINFNTYLFWSLFLLSGFGLIFNRVIPWDDVRENIIYFFLDFFKLVSIEQKDILYIGHLL